MLLQLNFSSEIPIYQQIRNEIVLGIANGSLRQGDKLPTIRALADEAGINMMTVNKAYQLLKQEGYIQTDRRSGAIISGKQEESGLCQKSVHALRLLVSEAKLNGMDKSALISLCGELYDEKEDE